MEAALKLCDVLKYVLTAPVRAIVVGMCSSAATFIYLHCAERWATPYAQFKIHSASFENVSIKVDSMMENNIQQLLAENKKVHATVVQLYMAQLNASKETVEQLMSRGDQQFDGYISAQEAFEIGFVQRIVDSKLDIF